MCLTSDLLLTAGRKDPVVSAASQKDRSSDGDPEEEAGHPRGASPDSLGVHQQCCSIEVTSAELPVCVPGARDDQGDTELQPDGGAAAAVRDGAPSGLEPGGRGCATVPERHAAGQTPQQQGR